MDLAPNVVADDWKKLNDAISSLAVRLAGHVGGAVALQFPARDRGRRPVQVRLWTSAYRCCDDAFDEPLSAAPRHKS